MARTPKIRRLRHRDLNGAFRGDNQSRRLRRVRRWLNFVTGDVADGGIGDTAAQVAFTATATVLPVAATGVLTATDPLVEDETVTIGSIVYTFKDVPANAYEVLVGSDEDETLTNLVDEINGDGASPAHPQVTAEMTDTAEMTVTARIPGTGGNSIATTTTAADASWGDTTLDNGSDTQSDGVLAITAHGYASGDGPFVLDTSGTLPGGLSDVLFYWVRVVSPNTVALHRSRTDAVFGINTVIITTTGSGSHTAELATSAEAIVEFLRQGVTAHQIAGLADIDDILPFL